MLISKPPAGRTSVAILLHRRYREQFRKHWGDGRMLMIELKFNVHGSPTRHLHIASAHIPSSANHASGIIDETIRHISSSFERAGGRRAMRILGIDANVRMRADMSDAGVVGTALENRPSASRSASRSIALGIVGEVGSLGMLFMNTSREFWGNKLVELDAHPKFFGHGHLKRELLRGERFERVGLFGRRQDHRRSDRQVLGQGCVAVRFRPPGPWCTTRSEPFACALTHIYSFPEAHRLDFKSPRACHK